MDATPHIIESALLLLVAFLLGCVVGYFARRFSGRRAPADPAPQAAPAPVAPAPVSAPVTSIPAAETPPAAKAVRATPARTARKPAAKKPAKRASAPKAPKSPPLPDDLKKIRGIGPRIEAGLNSHGVYRYAQIARWSRKRITELDTDLTLRGRIDREQWVEQAKALSKAAK